ncbi:MAG TPA: hypothetical protein VMW95_00100 [Desulfobacterales bacterium]|nr:hypothetical protein [Desulfobacterales bacterium]
MKKTNKTYYDDIITEIKAGMVIFISCPQDRAWNQASQRAIDIIKKYKKGNGLFQNET